MNKVQINQGRTMIPTYRWSLSLVLLFAILVAFSLLPEVPAILVAGGLSFLTPLLWSSFYILEIDSVKKKVSEYTLIMGKPFFKTETSFGSIEKIFINQNQTSQTMHSYAGKVSTISNPEYQAYLKFQPQQKFFLISDRSIERLDARLEPIAKKLDTVVVKNF